MSDGFQVPPSRFPRGILDRLDQWRYLNTVISALYAVLVISMFWRHEPWADEAHAWLLARDASLAELWTRLLHYEGSPGLWHTLLVLLNRVGLPYRSEAAISGLLGISAVFLLLKDSPFPTELRILLPFTFFLCYQYVVVARSYSLLAVLLFGCMAIYKHSEKRLYLFTFLLGLMAAVSVHGFILSGTIWFVSQLKFLRGWRELDQSARRRVLLSGAGYLLAILFVAYSTWPARDVGFPAHAELSMDRFLASADMFLTQGFTGNLYVTIFVIALSCPFLYVGGGLPVFLISLLSIVLFGGVVYSQVWHSGTVFLSWVAAMWISATNVRVPRAAYASLMAVILIQCFWTFMSISYDWSQPYSGSKEAARYIRSTGIVGLKPMAFGYSCTAIQPYFRGGVFSNYASGRAYWDWSTGNRVNEPGALFSANSSEYAVVGYKEASDMDWMKLPLRMSGYEQIKHFPGHLYWRTSTFEEESFDLYRRTSQPASVPNSYLSMADPSVASQLLSGFYEVEGKGWCWTARHFSVLLKPPVGNRGSTHLEVRLFISPDQFQRLGPMTLTGYVNGYKLQAETFPGSGTYVYKQQLPDRELKGDVVLGSFFFDKAVPPGKADGRELGAIVSSIGLLSHP